MLKWWEQNKNNHDMILDGTQDKNSNVFIIYKAEQILLHESPEPIFTLTFL